MEMTLERDGYVIAIPQLRDVTVHNTYRMVSKYILYILYYLSDANNQGEI